MNSAKSPIESLFTRASRGCGAFCLCLEPELAAGGAVREIGLLKGDLTDRGVSLTGFDATGFGGMYLLTEDE